MNRWSKKEKGTVLQLQDYSLTDGDGVRTIIFLAGCPMRCQWCANPESHTLERRIFHYEHKCIDCGRCVEICTEGKDPRKHQNCSMCGRCTDVCLVDALKMSGTEMTVDEVVGQIKRDSIFYLFSKSGVTFSGGEPFYQHEFLRALSERLEDMGIDMWVETCGQYQWSQVEDIAGRLSHAYCDIKHMDEEVHRKYTGMGNSRVIENVKHMYDAGIPVTVRIPLIPEVNFTYENLDRTAEFMKKNIPEADIELLPYHELGKTKYKALGMDFTTFTIPDGKDIEEAYRIFEKHNIKRKV